MPLISVIVPVYNAEKTIKRCVDSIRRQTFSDVEILLIEDGARDASGALCDSFAGEDARIRVLHKKNAGVSAARNSGLDMAQGTYIQFADSDDYLPEDYLEKLMQTQKKYGEEAFVWSGFGVVNGTDETMTEIIRYNEAETAECSRKDLFRFSGRYLLNSPWNKLFHRDVIEKNHLRMEEGLSIAEDLQFNMQYLDACGDVPVVICNTVQYRYVRTGQESLDNCYRAGYYDIHKRILTKQYRYAEKMAGARRGLRPFLQTVLGVYAVSPCQPEACGRQAFPCGNTEGKKEDFVRCLLSGKPETEKGKYGQSGLLRHAKQICVAV